MAHYSYIPRGVCSRQIDFDIEEGKVKNVKFTGGCNGNGKGISMLAEGMDVDEVVKRLCGVDCAGRGTSCPDQLSKALEAVKNQ